MFIIGLELDLGSLRNKFGADVRHQQREHHHPVLRRHAAVILHLRGVRCRAHLVPLLLALHRHFHEHHGLPLYWHASCRRRSLTKTHPAPCPSPARPRATSRRGACWPPSSPSRRRAASSAPSTPSPVRRGLRGGHAAGGEALPQAHRLHIFQHGGDEQEHVRLLRAHRHRVGLRHAASSAYTPSSARSWPGSSCRPSPSSGR